MTTLRLTRGDDRVFTVTVLDSSGAASDISKATALSFTARRGLDAEPLISKSLDAGVEIGDGTGEATVTLDSSDTVDLPNRLTDLIWDFEVTDETGSTQTPIGGVLRISPDLSTAGGS
jgi:hypothetical protein